MIHFYLCLLISMGVLAMAISSFNRKDPVQYHKEKVEILF